MPINRRTRSFSPYSYGIQYKHPGESPAVKKAMHIPTANSLEDEYVISKRPPLFNVCVKNSFIYYYDNNCVPIFAKGDSTFIINKISNPIIENTAFEEINFEKKITEVSLDEQSSDFSWLDETTVELKKVYDEYFDFIILKGNEYIIPEEIKLVDGKIRIKFNRHYENTRIIIFAINNAFNIIDDISIMESDGSLQILNKMGSLDVFPVIYREDGSRYLSKYDISPTYITFRKPEIPVSKIFLYNSKNTELYFVKYGQNSNTVEWNKNIVTISHNLNSYLKIYVDYVDNSTGMLSVLDSKTYQALALSQNTLQIDFGTNAMSEYCVALFAV